MTTVTSIRTTKSFRALIAAVSIAALGSTFAHGAPFTAGDLVVTQIGATGSGTALASTGTASFLHEFSTTGTDIQTLALPTAASGSNNPLTISGTAGSEGGLSLSSNGQYLVVGGYDVGVGGTTQGTATAGLVQVSTGNIDTSTTTTGLSGNNTRSATSTDGTEVWIAGAKGVVALADGGSGAGNTLASSNIRELNVVAAAVSPGGSDQLFGSSQKSPPGLGISTVGTGTPTSGAQTLSLLSGMTATTAPNSFGFFFANPTTLFVADATDGLQEWTLSSGNWSEVATLGTPSSDVGVAGVQNGSTVSLYFTTGTTSGWSADNKLEADTFTFTSGTSGPGTFSLPTTLATASGDSGFSGVALLPAVPEPFSSSLLLLGGLGMMLRRGSRRK